jgi:hypothetical protein
MHQVRLASDRLRDYSCAESGGRSFFRLRANLSLSLS